MCVESGRLRPSAHTSSQPLTAEEFKRKEGTDEGTSPATRLLVLLERLLTERTGKGKETTGNEGKGS